MEIPDWNDLRYFLAVAEAGSLSAAARRLRVEHTTVARRIDALEAALGQRLFDRLPRGWAPTAEGQSLLPSARRVGDDMAALLRAAGEVSPLVGTVSVSAPPALVAYVLAPGLGAALQRHPGIALDLAAEPKEVDLMRREADIAIRYRRPHAPAAAVRRLGTVRYALCCAARYRHRRDPAQWEFLGYGDEFADLPQQAWLDRLAVGRRQVLRTNDLATLAHAAAVGAGIAVLPEYVAHTLPELVVIDEHPCPVERPLWLAMHEDVRRSPRVRAVADEIVALFGAGEI